VKAIVRFYLVVAVIAVNIPSAPANEAAALAVLLVCSLDGARGPAVISSQPSTAFQGLCEQSDEDDVALCRTLSEVAETTCFTALAKLNAVGNREAATHAKSFLPANFRTDIGSFPTDDPDTEPDPARKPDVFFVLKSPDRSASLIACDNSDNEPRLVSVQSVSGNDAGVATVSCADDLQARLDEGEALADALTVNGWSPADKKAIVGAAKGGCYLPERGDEVLVGFPNGDANRIIYAFTALGSRRF
jgi:hypothetical protein